MCDNARKARWDAPRYVSLIEEYPWGIGRPEWLEEELREYWVMEVVRHQSEDGFFYCSFCGLWKPAAEIEVPSDPFLQLFFVCKDAISKCDAYKFDRYHPEGFMRRGWYPATLEKNC